MRPVGGNSGDDQRQPDQVLAAGQLVEQRDAASSGGDRQQREHEAVRRAGETDHRELVGEIGDHRRADADAEPPQEPGRVIDGGPGSADTERRRRDRADGNDETEPVERGAAALRGHVGESVADEHVEHEAEAVGDRQGQPDGGPGDADLDEQRDAGDGEGEGQDVAAGAGAVGREGDDAEELDAGDRRERQPVQREVEGGVHRREYDAERDDEQALVAAGPAPDRPRRTHQRQHQGGRGHPQPRHTHDVDVDEEEHREGRPQVVEGCADHHQTAAHRGRVPPCDGGCHKPIVRRRMGMLKAHS